jgi:hypothetical protein
MEWEMSQQGIEWKGFIYKKSRCYAACQDKGVSEIQE